MPCRGVRGIALIETAILVATASVLVGATAWTVSSAVEVSQEAVAAANAQLQGRRGLDFVEEVLSSSSLETLEGVEYDKKNGSLEDFCRSIEDSMGGAHPGALPLDKKERHNVFFRLAPVDPSLDPGTVPPLAFFLRPAPHQDPDDPETRYELAYFDGERVDTVMSDLEEAEFDMDKDGLVEVTVKVIVGIKTKGKGKGKGKGNEKADEFETDQVKRKIVVRMS